MARSQHHWRIPVRHLAFAAALLLTIRNGSRARAPKPKGVPDNVTAHINLEYVPGGHERQKLDLFVPKDAAGPLPIVVWVHGGGWNAGRKDNPPILALASKG